MYPERTDARCTNELVGMLEGSKERLQLWRSSSTRAGADAALMLIMSWHEDIKLGQIQTLRDGGAWNTKPNLIEIREQAANFMAKYANTSELDLEADVYSDPEDAAFRSDAADSGDSGNSQDSNDDGDDADSDGGDRRIPPGVRFTGSGKAIFADTSLSDSSLMATSW